MTELSERVERAQQAQAGALARAEDGENIYEIVRRNEGQIAAALPSFIAPEAFVRFALTELRRNEKLRQCDPASVMGAIMLSAQLGLAPGPLGHVYLVPYGREAQFQIGYKGYVALAARAGYAITGDAIREGDGIDYRQGSGAYLIHTPKIRGAGDTYAWWAMAERPGMTPSIKVLNREQVDRFRRRAKASGSGPWATDYDAMALKTVVRRVMALLPLDEQQSAPAADGFAADGARAVWSGAHELTVERPDFEAWEAEPEPEPEGEPE